MILHDHYDVICAGGGLSSYLCAALLAKAGKQVLLIDDEGEIVPERPLRDRIIFDTDFSIFTGLEQSAALGKSLSELGILQNSSAEPEELPSKSNFKPLESIDQILTPDYRIVFWNDGESLCREIRREMKSKGDPACRFFSQLYGASSSVSSFVESVLTTGQAGSSEVVKWRKFWGHYWSSIIKQTPVPLNSVVFQKDGDVCENLCAALLTALSYSTPINLGVEQILRSLPLFLKGQYCYIGGEVALKNMLGDVIKSCNGEIKRNARVESLITESKKISGVLLSSFEGIIGADAVVLSSSLKRLYLSLPKEAQDIVVARGLNRVEPTHWRFTLSIKVKKNVIPIGATSNMTYIGSYQYPLEEENCLQIRTLPAGLYPDLEDRDAVTLLVTSFVPLKASSMDYAYLRRLGGKMLRSLSALMPFLTENIIGLYPDFRSGEQELSESYPFRGTGWVSEKLLQYYIRGYKSVQDFWGPSWTTSHPNLYFAGRSIWPSLGTYGEALSARKIFDDIMLPSTSI